jgi:hypothetical protein
VLIVEMSIVKGFDRPVANTNGRERTVGSAVTSAMHADSVAQARSQEKMGKILN